MSGTKRFWKIGLPLLILVGGVLAMVTMIKGRSAPSKQEAPFRGVLVETIIAERQPRPVRIAATGTVQARQETEIVPQVSGMVTEVGPNLVAGGFVRAGELLFAVEQVDFQLAVDRARANLTRAELDLETVRAQADIARSEWGQLHPGEEPSPLVVYLPQLKSAEAALASARAGLRQAQLDLQRTRLTAPYNGYLRSESVDLGQYLRSGTRVATLVGTDAAEIIVPLQLEELQWLDVPRRTGQQGSGAVATLPVSGGQSWTGWIDRSLGEVDPQGRMARVAVLVSDPYGLEHNREAKLPLAVGSFVEVTFAGKTLPQVVELPRRALRDDATVWVMDAENKLRTVPVEVLRRERETVLIGEGLAGGEQVVVTPVSGAADGLLLRQAE
jgi:RND family efflux transporter MFP subunit